jgi:hypothetical protein
VGDQHIVFPEKVADGPYSVVVAQCIPGEDGEVGDQHMVCPEKVADGPYSHVHGPDPAFAGSPFVSIRQTDPGQPGSWG